MAKKAAAEKTGKGKGKGAPAPVAPAPVRELGKNEMLLPDGSVIQVRGPEKKRTGYIGGNVQWQEFLANLRLQVNVATYLTKIGAPSHIVDYYMAKADEEVSRLNTMRVTIPGDVLTMIAALKADLAEAPVGSEAYVKAIRKIGQLVRFVEIDMQSKVNAELLQARKALQTIKA